MTAAGGLPEAFWNEPIVCCLKKIGCAVPFTVECPSVRAVYAQVSTAVKSTGVDRWRLSLSREPCSSARLLVRAMLRRGS